MKNKIWNGKEWPYKKYCPIGNYDLLCMRCGAWHGKQPVCSICGHKINKSDKKGKADIIEQAKKEFIRDMYWLIGCEIDLLETNGWDTKSVKNIIRRIEGHFGIKMSQVRKD